MPQASAEQKHVGAYSGSSRTAVSVLIVGLMNLPLLRALAMPLSLSSPYASGEPEESPMPDDASLWLYLSIALALVVLGGIFAGLTIAFMGQDEIYLEVIRSSGEGMEKVHAETVLRLLKRGKHWVLVTLLLSNVITNETLPIVLDRSLGGGWKAVVISTALIVVFGEVIPQSLCVRYGLPIGSYLAPAVLGLMYIMSPVAWPTAKLLDYLLGNDHGTVYKKAGLKTLVSLHMSLGKTPAERLNEDEVTIITAVLDLKAKSVGSIMTPIEHTFTMSSETVLDEKTVGNILASGFSRIPIYMPENSHDFVGMLLVRMLITYDPEDEKRVCDLPLATLPETEPGTSCLDIINFFQEGKSHMVVVSDSPGSKGGALGVVTLEDVIEELIGEEIIDESDVFVDVHNARRRSISAPIFQLRRRSTALSSREQSAQLGPANLASNPAQTRYSTIKIKPGISTSNEVTQESSDTVHSGQQSHEIVEWRRSPQVAATVGHAGSGPEELESDERAPLLNRSLQEL